MFFWYHQPRKEAKNKTKQTNKQKDNTITNKQTKQKTHAYESNSDAAVVERVSRKKSRL